MTRDSTINNPLDVLDGPLCSSYSFNVVPFTERTTPDLVVNSRVSARSVLAPEVNVFVTHEGRLDILPTEINEKKSQTQLLCDNLMVARRGMDWGTVSLSALHPGDLMYVQCNSSWTHNGFVSFSNAHESGCPTRVQFDVGHLRNCGEIRGIDQLKYFARETFTNKRTLNVTESIYVEGNAKIENYSSISTEEMRIDSCARLHNKKRGVFNCATLLVNCEGLVQNHGVITTTERSQTLSDSEKEQKLAENPSFGCVKVPHKRFICE